jgi:hypothetical protein
MTVLHYGTNSDRSSRLDREGIAIRADREAIAGSVGGFLGEARDLQMGSAEPGGNFVQKGLSEIVEC